jgi:hypothetical protein
MITFDCRLHNTSTASVKHSLSEIRAIVPSTIALKGNQFLHRPIIAFTARNKRSERPLSPVRLISQEGDDEQSQD